MMVVRAWLRYGSGRLKCGHCGQQLRGGGEAGSEGRGQAQLLYCPKARGPVGKLQRNSRSEYRREQPSTVDPPQWHDFHRRQYQPTAPGGQVARAVHSCDARRLREGRGRVLVHRQARPLTFTACITAQGRWATFPKQALLGGTRTAWTDSAGMLTRRQRIRPKLSTNRAGARSMESGSDRTCSSRRRLESRPTSQLACASTAITRSVMTTQRLATLTTHSPQCSQST
jgi:hypothetical protein